MKPIKNLVCVISLTLSILLISLTQGENKTLCVENSVLEIWISTSDSTVKLNGFIINDYKVGTIEKIIGKADRIKIHTYKTWLERYGIGDTPPYSYSINVTDYYYIYDKLGIMFYTRNGLSSTEIPVCMSIHFKNKRVFTNRKALPYSPASCYKGTLKINGNIVSPDMKIIPDSVHYNTPEFKLYDMYFGPCSIATVIDRLYSVKCLPNMMIYLDNEKNQRISYIVL